MKPSEVQQIIETNTREEIVEMALAVGIDPETTWHTPSRELIDEIEAKREGFSPEMMEAGIEPIEIEVEGNKGNVLGAALDEYIEVAVAASSAEEILEAAKKYKQVFTDNCGPEYSEENIEIDSSVDIGYVNAIVWRRRGQTMEEFNRFMGWTE